MKIFNFYKKIFLLISFIFISNLFLANFSIVNAMQQTTSTATQEKAHENEHIEQKNPEDIRWDLISQAIQNKLESLKNLQDKLKAKKTELENLIKNKANVPDLNSKLETANRYIERLNAFIEFESNTIEALKIERFLKEKINNAQIHPNMSPEAITQLNLYANQENPENYLFQIIDRTQLSFAKIHLANTLSKNPHNIDLDIESAKLHALESNSDFFDQLNTALNNFAQSEKLFFEELKTLKKDFEIINHTNAVNSSNSWANFVKASIVAYSVLIPEIPIPILGSKIFPPKLNTYGWLQRRGIDIIHWTTPLAIQDILATKLKPKLQINLPKTPLKRIFNFCVKEKKFMPTNLLNHLKKPLFWLKTGIICAPIAFPTLKYIPFINPALQFLYKKYTIRNLNKIKRDILIKHIKNMQIILNSLVNINNIIKNYTVFNNLSEQIESLINNQTQPALKTAIDNIINPITDKIDLIELEQKFKYIKQVFNSKINENTSFISIIKNTAELDYFVSIVKLKKDREFLSKMTEQQREFFAQTNILC